MKRASWYAATLLLLLATASLGFGWIDILVKPVVPNSKYLVVLEHNWEENLSQPQYSEGEMFRVFFAMHPQIQVRHRYFTDAASLKKWLGEIAAIKGDVYLVLADHGSPDGLYSSEDDIGTRAIADGLEGAKNLKLIHFSACSVMRGGFPMKLIFRMGKTAPAVSGYASDVDWAFSQITDFMFLDLVLNDGYSPLGASFELKRLMPLAGSSPIANSPHKPLEFTIVDAAWIWGTRGGTDGILHHLIPLMGEPTNAIQIEGSTSIPGSEQPEGSGEVCSGDPEGDEAAEAH